MLIFLQPSKILTHKQNFNLKYMKEQIFLSLKPIKTPKATVMLH